MRLKKEVKRLKQQIYLRPNISPVVQVINGIIVCFKDWKQQEVSRITEGIMWHEPTGWPALRAPRKTPDAQLFTDEPFNNWSRHDAHMATEIKPGCNCRQWTDMIRRKGVTVCSDKIILAFSRNKAIKT